MIVLFSFVSLAVLSWWLWGKLFSPVPKGVLLLFLVLTTVYEADVLFQSRVEAPAHLAMKAYPWKATGVEPPAANTGIVLTQLVPWTREARDQLKSGEVPLWNRKVAAGNPLLPNQQTAIFHPYTILGLPFGITDAWDLSVCLRLFFSLFFAWVWLSSLGLARGAAIFGAVAWTYSVFHIVWLLFPLGLTAMMLPLALVATRETMHRPGLRSASLLILALGMIVLGGHPETELMAGLTVGTYALYETLCMRNGRLGSEHSPLVAIRRLSLAGLCALTAVLITAPVWLPTAELLKQTPRYMQFEAMRSSYVTTDRISSDWLLTLLSPNVLGTVQDGTYRPPEPNEPSLLHDYGEVATGYAGIIPLALCISSLVCCKRWGVMPFVIGMGIVAFLTLYETPGWTWLLHQVPFVGVALHQRIRLLFGIAVVIAAAIALSGFLEGRVPVAVLRRGAAIAAAVVSAVFFFRLKEYLLRDIAIHQTKYLAVSLLTILLLWVALSRTSPRTVAMLATVLTFLEIVLLTWNYNPSSRLDSFYPMTPAISALQGDDGEPPSRMVAMGWTFIPDTPGFYGLEDIKTTDPIQFAPYSELVRTYLSRGDYDLTITRPDSNVLDFLNVGRVYAPPGSPQPAPGMLRVYDGPDGVVFENQEALPRYYTVARFVVEPNRHTATQLLGELDLSAVAVVDHIPQQVLDLAGHPDLQTQPATVIELGTAGTVRLEQYLPRSMELKVDHDGWSLLVSSDVNWPGWRAYWNGKRFPTVTVNGAFLGLFVPPGKGTVEFVFSPEPYDDGRQLAGIAFSILLLTVALVLLRRRQIFRSTTSQPVTGTE